MQTKTFFFFCERKKEWNVEWDREEKYEAMKTWMLASLRSETTNEWVYTKHRKNIRNFTISKIKRQNVFFFRLKLCVWLLFFVIYCWPESNKGWNVKQFNGNASMKRSSLKRTQQTIAKANKTTEPICLWNFKS